MRTFLRLTILAPVFLVGAPLAAGFAWLLGESYREAIREFWAIYLTGDLPSSAK